MVCINIIKPECSLYFGGIGGIGMSGLAKIASDLGCKVRGSDISRSDNVERLEEHGIQVFIGHDPAHLNNVDYFIRSSAVKDDNPEVLHCRKHGIPIISRAEFLAELLSGNKAVISVSGTHGKTTTTSLIATMLKSAGLAPSLINGGISNDTGTNIQTGDGKYVVVEADESDATFIKIPSTVAVITNVDAEHLDYYKTYENIIAAFTKFLEDLPFYGFGVVCADHAQAKKIAQSVTTRDVYTYGVHSEDADVFAHNIRPTDSGYKYDVKISQKLSKTTGEIKDIELGMKGMHNIQNSLSAVITALKLGVSADHIKIGLKNFAGVKRRFTPTGEVNGVRFFDDYGHHPQEVKATLKIAREMVESTGGKVFLVFQPHKYTRLHDLFDEFTNSFNDADLLYIADVYSAREKPIEGINSDALVKAVKAAYPAKQCALVSKNELPEIIKSTCKSGDLVLFMGAGDITHWAYEIPKLLKDQCKVM